MTEGADQRGEMLRAFLAEHDEPCPMCRYNLRGIAGGVCPECGEGLRLAVRRDSAHPGWYTIGRLGIIIAAALHVAPMLLFLPWSVWLTVILLPGSAVSLLTLAAWVGLRHRVARAGTLTRACIVLIAATTPLWTLVLTILVGAGEELL